jgi:hypothetical protein
MKQRHAARKRNRAIQLGKKNRDIEIGKETGTCS